MYQCVEGVVTSIKDVIKPYLHGPVVELHDTSSERGEWTAEGTQVEPF